MIVTAFKALVLEHAKNTYASKSVFRHRFHAMRLPRPSITAPHSRLIFMRNRNFSSFKAAKATDAKLGPKALMLPKARPEFEMSEEHGRNMVARNCNRVARPGALPACPPAGRPLLAGRPAG